MFANPGPEDDEDTPFTAYDCKWAIVYTAIAWAATFGTTVSIVLALKT